MSRDPWKLVTSADELRAGMTVELRPNLRSGKKERFLLTRRDPRTKLCRDCNEWGPNDYDWFTADDRTHFCCKASIRERRLYALIDDDTAADETTVTRRRERVE